MYSVLHNVNTLHSYETHKMICEPINCCSFMEHVDLTRISSLKCTINFFKTNVYDENYKDLRPRKKVPPSVYRRRQRSCIMEKLQCANGAERSTARNLSATEPSILYERHNLYTLRSEPRTTLVCVEMYNEN